MASHGPARLGMSKRGMAELGYGYTHGVLWSVAVWRCGASSGKTEHGTAWNGYSHSGDSSPLQSCGVWPCWERRVVARIGFANTLRHSWAQKIAWRGTAMASLSAAWSGMDWQRDYTLGKTSEAL